ncbi:hypothetical protein AOQ84DRAFT_377343 [Glonium stellatum]|uniref:Uncharacterized protein n=1 Tax=Glonium stellatum TaxID=574774 RepID=A0A8E2EZM2_9PEZI|nr:hypothetical protein AOQ84DRAFT_377343 [Glonium stellatum]
MPVPFGFSAGDIVIAIQLLIKIYKSLKEAGGAASEYHDVSRFLRGLILTLQHLQEMELICGDPSLVKAIQALSATALQPIFQFVEEIQKYSSAMEASPLSHYSMATYRKVGWALRVSKKIEKLRVKILAEMQPIHLLIESQNLRCFDLTSKQLSSLQQSLDPRATEQLAFNSTMIKAIEDLYSAVKESGSSQSGIAEADDSEPKEENEIDSNASSKAIPIRGSRSSLQVNSWNEIGQNLVTLLLGLLTEIRHITKYLFSFFFCEHSSPQSPKVRTSLFKMISTSKMF